MNLLARFSGNPILSKEPQNPWESFAAFNGSVAKHNGEYVLFYRAMSQNMSIENVSLHQSVIGRAQSGDGVTFSNHTLWLAPQEKWEKFGCEDPRVCEIDGTYLVFYTALSQYPPKPEGIRVAVALSQDLLTIDQRHLVTPFNAKAMVMFPEKINGKYTVLLTVNTDIPPSVIALAQFEKLETLWDQEYWNNWYSDFASHSLALRRVNSDQVEVGAVPTQTPEGWILFYSYIHDYFHPEREFRIEAVLLDPQNPQNIIGRIQEPCLIAKEEYEKKGQIQNVVFPSGALLEGNKLTVYYGAADSVCCAAIADIRQLKREFEVNSPSPVMCQKFPNNPLLTPEPSHEWESKSVFNPAAVLVDGKTYILYRASSSNDISSIGMCVSEDGLYIDERLPEPIYQARAEFEKNSIVGNAGGCEDPRVTIIGDTLYMCYTAYNGKLPVLALTSISLNDFLKRNWEKWTWPKIISKPGVADKDGCLFPRKIKGKYVFFHRIEPNIVVDMVDDLEFLKKTYLEANYPIAPQLHSWDSIKIGINTPPIETKYGWLVFYHGISELDHAYRIGAMLLDRQDVTNVIARTPYPILEPEFSYERNGVVPNVVFPCGYVIHDDLIYLYYGGADATICGATINIKELLSYLIHSKTKRFLEM